MEWVVHSLQDLDIANDIRLVFVGRSVAIQLLRGHFDHSGALQVALLPWRHDGHRRARYSDEQ